MIRFAKYYYKIAKNLMFELICFIAQKKIFLTVFRLPFVLWIYKKYTHSRFPEYGRANFWFTTPVALGGKTKF